DHQGTDPQEPDIAFVRASIRARRERRRQGITGCLDQLPTQGRDSRDSKMCHSGCMIRYDSRRPGPTRCRTLASKGLLLPFALRRNGRLRTNASRRTRGNGGEGVMVTRYLMLLAALVASTAVSAQTATTTLDAVSGVPEIDKATQTQDVQFHNERDDR